MGPWARGNCLIRSRWLVTLAVGLGAPSGPSFWAIAGADTTIPSTIMAKVRRRMRTRNVMTIILLPCCDHPPRPDRSDLDVLAISRQPAPGAGAIAPLQDTLLVDLGDDVAIAR